MIETITPAKIRRGDRMCQPDGSLSWIAVGDAERHGSLVIVEVQYADGGCTFREWDYEDFPSGTRFSSITDRDGHRHLHLCTD